MAFDKRHSWDRAKKSLDRGQPHAALSDLWSLVDRTHLVREELNTYLDALGHVYAQIGRTRAAATIALYSGDVAEAAELSQSCPTDLARCAIKQGNIQEAARQYCEYKWIGHAAIQLEQAGDDRGARVLWERLSEAPELRDDTYTQGLVRFNLGRASRRLGDTTAYRAAIVRSIHLLEAAADEFERMGLRERAFDCFQVLLTLGKDGAFENLSEGYLNCIRILKEDNLKYYVLQYYEDFQTLAIERSEFHAAATLFREAAGFCVTHGLPYARHYREKAAECAILAAEQTQQSGGPHELAEHAYAVAIEAFNELGSYSRVREVYETLVNLDLEPARVARYKRLRERLRGAPDEIGQTVMFPDYLRMETAYPEIWRLDVVEWEQAGDPAETMGEVLQEPKWPEFTRRRALLCRLHQLGNEVDGDATALGTSLAGYLGRVEIYASLAPLEHLFEVGDVEVRAACVRAVRHLYFKRSFLLANRGLEDKEPTVRREALAAISSLHFTHAFDPLRRIHRTTFDPVVRQAALSSIGRIATLEAAELLVTVVRQGPNDDRQIAADLLIRMNQPSVDHLVTHAAETERGPAAKALQRIMTSRGLR